MYKIDRHHRGTRNLRDGDIVVFFGLRYEVAIGAYGLYLYGLDGTNDAMFKALGMNRTSKERFVQDVLGYCQVGEFPYCKNGGDLMYLVNALFDREMEASTERADNSDYTGPEDQEKDDGRDDDGTMAFFSKPLYSDSRMTEYEKRVRRERGEGSWS